MEYEGKEAGRENVTGRSLGKISLEKLFLISVT
jgi:hypothetical protein